MTHPYRLVVLLALAAGCGGSMAPDDSGTTPEDVVQGQDTGSPGNDSGTTDDTGILPMDVPQVACTSGTHWTRGTHGSAEMEPGLACIACHTTMRGPTISIGGTVYPSSHEEDTCNGATGATVEITDANGRVVTLTTNSAGNFYTNTSIAFPIHARVMHNGNVNAMITAQTTGDCNSCHTQAGTMAAPGRIVAP